MNERELPPAKNYGGVDIENLFSQLLFKEASAMVLRDHYATAEASKLFAEWKQINDEADKTTQALKDANAYFYQEGGSVFMDYKNLIDHTFPNGTDFIAWIRTHIRIDMTTQEALHECRNLVESWWKK